MNALKHPSLARIIQVYYPDFANQFICKGFYAMKVREIVRMLQDDGWYQVRMKGSHRHFKHNLKTGLVTVPGNPGKELAKGTLGSIFKQAGLNK